MIYFCKKKKKTKKRTQFPAQLYTDTNNAIRLSPKSIYSAARRINLTRNSIYQNPMLNKRVKQIRGEEEGIRVDRWNFLTKTKGAWRNKRKARRGQGNWLFSKSIYLGRIRSQRFTSRRSGGLLLEAAEKFPLEQTFSRILIGRIETRRTRRNRIRSNEPLFIHRAESHPRRG